MKDAQERANEIRKKLRHMVLAIAPFESDLLFAAEQWVKDSRNQFWRRTLIRCLLAQTEVVLWNMKHVTPGIACLNQVGLSTAEVEFLNEERNVVRDGKTEVRRNYPPFRENIKGTLSLFAKAHRISFNLNYDSKFDALCATYELRNRLMHPKKPMDADVSDDAIATAQSGVAWFMQYYPQLLKQCGDSLPAIAARNH
jgi:hypothetical protein